MRLRLRNAQKKKSQGISVQRQWAPGVFALLLALSLSGLGLLSHYEQWLYRQTLHYFAPAPNSEKIVVLAASTEKNEVQLTLAHTLERLSQASAVGVMLPLDRDENKSALSLVEGRLGGGAEEGNRNPVAATTLRALAQELDSTGQLVSALRENGRVILGIRASEGSRVLHDRSQLIQYTGLVALEHIPVLDEVSSVITPENPVWIEEERPLAVFRKAASGVGTTAAGGIAFPLVVKTGQSYVPSFLLQLFRLNHRIPANAEFEFSAANVSIGAVRLRTDHGYRLYPYAPLDGGFEGLEHYSLTAIAEGNYPPDHFRDKTVLIGAANDPELAREAWALAAVMNQALIAVPFWSLWGEYGALLAVTLLLIFLLPRMGYTTAAVTVLLTTLLLVNGEFLLLVLERQWLPLMLPLLVLWLGYPLIAFRRYLAMRHEHLAVELSEANRHLGRMLQSQGELEMALEKYRRCRVDESLLEQLYHLGLDFERKRQFSKAVSVFQYLNTLSRGFRDVSDRIKRNQSMEQRIVLANGSGATPEGTVIMSAEGLQNPTVGHYQIEREIGRGAMGMVYLGKDPRIGRPVAIKTMALSSEFEGAQLEEVKKRFYREAETAGRLNHPNIVHIYDVGEEQELAYIAMDYLQGENLGRFIDKDTLLPIKEVLGIAEKVAEALDYAHKRSVVHRDIKPANIIYDSKENAVKVTDFGVACLTDSSKTKTGTVLGSPSYMSPEQVAGKRVDGRTDIFSLGVTLYQMITGHLPFEADSLGSLMYKITNKAQPKPSKYRKGLPVCVSRIISKCMQKDAGKRYQSGAELAAALKRCRGK